VDTGNLSPGTWDWSFEAWINPTSVSPADDAGRQLLYNDFGVDSNVLQVYLTNNELTTYWRDGAGSDAVLSSVGAGLQANTWQQVRLERAGDDLTFYVNGSSVGTAPLPSGFNMDTSGGRPPIFGHHGSAGMYWIYQGDLDDVVINVVPEPSTLILLVFGLLSVLSCGWKRYR
jgi:hypothetical protein